MTVSATPYKESYTGNGVTTAFPVPFYFLVDTDLVVSDVNNTVTPAVITPLAINVDYTVAGAGTPTGGVVNTTVPVAVGHGLTVERSLVEDQPTHFVDGDPLPASGLEQALDRIVMLYQQAKAALDRSAKFVVGSTSTTDLPEPAEGYVLGWVSGKLRNLAAASAQLAADLLSTAIGKGAALIGCLASFTGAVARTQHEKNSDFVSVKDFGAVGDGVADDTASIQAAIDASLYVFIPAGIYSITSALRLKNPKQKFIGAGSGATQIKPAATFSASTVGGQTYSAAIWYQPTSGNWYDTTGWIIGGNIEGITVNCSSAPCIGILFNRVTQKLYLSDVHIFYPTIGILSTWLGWCHTYSSVYIQDASIASIRLGNGCNGVSMDGCYLWGADVTTPVHLDINGDLYHGNASAPMQGSSGNSFVGGAIEGGLLGCNINVGQCSFNGVDFESLAQGFCSCKGFYNPGLQLAGPSVVFNGCQFVGLPSSGYNGFNSDGAAQSHHGCYYLNVGAPPSTQYLFNATAYGQALSNLAAQCISVINPTIIGWSTNIYTGLTPNTQIVGEFLCDGIEVSSKKSGAWTPVLTPSLFGASACANNAEYTIIGNICFFRVYLLATSGTFSTNISSSTITGLPVAPYSQGGAMLHDGADNSYGVCPITSTSGGTIKVQTTSGQNNLLIDGFYFIN